MTADNRSKIEVFKAQVQGKIETLLSEFADGKLNREQFHNIYAHYSNQITLANQALMEGDTSAVDSNNAGQTIAIRQAFMAKALGLTIYHNKSAVMIETLGEFDIPSQFVAPVLNDFSQLMEARQFIDRRVLQVDNRRWLLFAAGRYTTVVTVFQHEPSQHQSREIERLHHDFEVANEAFLTSGWVDRTKLAYPFMVFVQQKLGSRP
jgi:hypothetical protein